MHVSFAAAQAFDGRDDTHWFSRDGRSLADRVATHVWLEYCLPAQAGSSTLVAYTLTAASGRPENDPVHVVLHGVRLRCHLMAITSVCCAACSAVLQLLFKRRTACMPVSAALRASHKQPQDCEKSARLASKVLRRGVTANPAGHTCACCWQAPSGPNVKQPAPWEALHQRDDIMFSRRGEKLELRVEPRMPCRCVEAWVTTSCHSDTTGPFCCRSTPLQAC